MTIEPDEALTAGAPAPTRGGPRAWLGQVYSVVLGIAGLGLFPVFGWLEEVGRGQAVDSYYGLPVTMSGDARAAVVYAGFPLAMGVLFYVPLVTAVALTWRHHPIVAAAVVAGGIVVIIPPTSRTALLVKMVVIVGVEVACLLVPAWAWDRLRRCFQPVSAWITRRWGGLRRWWDTTTGSLMITLMTTAAAAAVAIYGSLAIGTANGHLAASRRTSYFVLDDRTCHPGIAVLALAQDGDRRSVRVVHREPGQDHWTPLPGIFTVPSGEPFIEVALGRITPSAPAPYPPPNRSALPPRCP